MTTRFFATLLQPPVKAIPWRVTQPVAGELEEEGWQRRRQPAADGTVEAWGRSSKNPVRGWYGLKKGLRGRFGMYMPPLLEALGMAEVEHNPKSNRMRAI